MRRRAKSPVVCSDNAVFVLSNENDVKLARRFCGLQISYLEFFDLMCPVRPKTWPAVYHENSLIGLRIHVYITCSGKVSILLEVSREQKVRTYLYLLLYVFLPVYCFTFRGLLGVGGRMEGARRCTNKAETRQESYFQDGRAHSQ